MSQIPISALNPARLLMQQKSIDLQELYDLCNVCAEHFNQKDCWVPLDSMLNSLTLVEKYSSGQPLSLVMLSHIPLTAFGDFGVGVMSAPSYNEALTLLTDFGHIIAPGLYFSSIHTDDYVTVHIRNEGLFKQYGDVMIELALMQMRNFLPNPHEATLSVIHSPLKDPVIASFLHSLFEFNAASNSITFPITVLEQKVMMSEPTMYATSVKALSELEIHTFLNKPFSLQVKQCISNFLTEGEIVTLEKTATSMNSTPRTLSRRLKSEDNNFKDLLNVSRMEVAKKLIENKVPVKIISSKLGFRTVKGFNLAFERITGCSPVAWRNKI